MEGSEKEADIEAQIQEKGSLNHPGCTIHTRGQEKIGSQRGTKIVTKTERHEKGKGKDTEIVT